MRDSDPCPTCGQVPPCACTAPPEPAGIVIPFPVRRPTGASNFPEDTPPPPGAA